MIKQKLLCLGLAVFLSVGTANYPSGSVDAKSIISKIEEEKKIGDFISNWYDVWGEWHDPEKEPEDQYNEFGEYIGPEVTGTPDGNENVTGGVVETERPEPTSTPKPSLEKPNKHYYTFWDRAVDIYKNPNKDFLVSDVKKGAAKQVNSKMPVKWVKWNKSGHATITLPLGKTYRIKLKGVKKYKRVNASYDSYIMQKTGTTKYNVNTWTKIRSTKNWKYYNAAESNFYGIERYGFKTNKGYFRVDIKAKKPYTVGKQSLYKNKSKISKYTWKSLLPNAETDFDCIISKEAENTNSLNEGYTKYCTWDEDYIYVQGYKCPKVETYGWKLTVRSLLNTCASIDYAIDSMRIPSASKMSREQCCKWIRRNSKQLINMLYHHEGCHDTVCWQAIYPILDKASKYDLADEFTKNSLVYFVPTKIASKKLRCDWMKKYKVDSIDRIRRLRTDTVSINGNKVKTKGYYTWVGGAHGSALYAWTGSERNTWKE